MFIVIGTLFFVALLASYFLSTVGWAVTYALLLVAILSITIDFNLMYRRPFASRRQP